MSRCQRVLIEDLAVCGLAAMKAWTIPRRDAAFFVLIILLRVVPGPRDLIGVAHLVVSAGRRAVGRGDLLGGVDGQLGLGTGTQGKDKPSHNGEASKRLHDIVVSHNTSLII